MDAEVDPTGRGLPLHWRVRCLDAGGPVASAEAIREWRAAAGLDAEEAWQERLDCLQADEQAVAACLAGVARCDVRRLDVTMPAVRVVAALTSAGRTDEAAADKRAVPTPAELVEVHERVLADLLPARLQQAEPRVARRVIDCLARAFAQLAIADLDGLLGEEGEALVAAGMVEAVGGALAPDAVLTRLSRMEGSLGYLVDEYPALPFHIASHLERCRAVATTFGAHLLADAGELSRQLGGERRQLLDVRLVPGFDHVVGRTECTLRLDGEVHVRYLGPEVANLRWFLALARWLEQSDVDIGAGAYALLDRGDHGWLRLPVGPPAIGGEARQELCRRTGGLLAIAYATGGHHLLTDAIQASGACPVLVRFDTLFSPLFRAADAQQSAEDPLGAWSVLNSYLLPRWRLHPDGAIEAYTSGGLASVLPSQSTPREGAVWPRTASSMAHGALECSVPMVDDVIEGFRACCEALHSNRHALDDAAWFRDGLSACVGRVILSDSWRYRRLRQLLLAPAALADALEGDRTLEALWRRRSVIRPAAVIQRELESLWAGRCPEFWTRGEDTALYDEAGTLVAPAYCRESIASAFRRRLAAMDPTDQRKQSWLILQSVAADLARSSEDDGALDALMRRHCVPVQAPTAGSAARRDLADLAAAVLLSSSACSGQRQWWGAHEDAQGRWELGQIPWGLYSGLDGIGLFLLYYGSLRRDAECLARASALVERAAEQVEHALLGAAPTPPVRWSAFHPPLSSLYFLLHACALSVGARDARAALERASSIVAGADLDVERDGLLDGLCGVIHLLASVYEATGSTAALEAATRGVLRLRSAWGVEAASVGLGYGLAGRLYTVWRVARIAETRWLLEYGRELEDATLGAVAREGGEPASGGTAGGYVGPWSTGIDGTVLALATAAKFAGRSAPHHPVLEVADRMTAGANATTGAAAIDGSYARALALDACLPAAGGRASAFAAARGAAIRELAARPWSSRLPRSAVPVLGLFNGLTGAGYATLREAHGAAVPAVWLLERPAHPLAATHP